MKTGVLYGIVDGSKTRVRCIICGVYIPKANKCIEQHTSGAQHKETIEVMKENGILLNECKIRYCKLCNKELDIEESVVEHTEDDEHSTWISAMEDLTDGEFLNLEDYFTSDSANGFCDACGEDVEVTLQNIESHVNSWNHRKNIINKLRPINGMFRVSSTLVWCKICVKEINNSVEDILQHIDDDPIHASCIEDFDDAVENHDISIERYLTVKEENNAFCNKCQTEFYCNLQILDDHIISDSHLSHF